MRDVLASWKMCTGMFIAGTIVRAKHIVVFPFGRTTRGVGALSMAPACGLKYIFRPALTRYCENSMIHFNGRGVDLQKLKSGEDSQLLSQISEDITIYI